jgi:hypothetical protein
MKRCIPRRTSPLREALLGLAAGLAVLTSAASAATTATRISGEVFGDYFSVAGHHDTLVDGQNGFWFRRINLTFDNVLSSSLSFRFKLEMSSAGDFKSNALLTPFVKDAFVNWHVHGQDLQVGIIGTPTWENVEPFWGYRALEKTPCDLQKFGSARDFGLSLRGPLNAAGTLSYKVMFGNGEGNNAESNKGKKAYAQVTAKPFRGALVELYADTERQKDARTYRLAQLFAGYEGRWGRAGFLYARRQMRLGDARDHWSVLSAIAVLKALPKADLVFRFDRTPDPNPAGPGISYIPFSDKAASNFVIAGVGWKVADTVVLIPNVKHVFYDKAPDGFRPGSDTYVNLSASLKF